MCGWAAGDTLLQLVSPVLQVPRLLTPLASFSFSVLQGRQEHLKAVQALRADTALLQLLQDVCLRQATAHSVVHSTFSCSS